MFFSQFQGALIGGFYPPFFQNNDSFSLPWQKGYLGIVDALIKHEPLTSDFWKTQSNVITPLIDEPTQLTLMLLPLFVYYHDDLVTLKKQIDTFLSVYSLNSSYRESLYLFASAIAACLRRQDTGLITKLIENHPQFNLSSHLIWLQNRLSDGIPLNQLVQQFSKELDPKLSPFLIALFVVFDTLEMPHLALQRVSQIHVSKESTSLTGVLLGAMGNIEKLSLTLRFNYFKRVNEQQLIPQINTLWQQWTGNLSDDLAYSIATPLIMQPRPSLQLISQQEYLTFPTLLKKEDN
ncbi:MAG: hypothetical protein AB4041_07910 [Microcystaceae cyanobacterium]